MTKFYVVKVTLLDQEIAINERSIVAVLPTGEPQAYRIWLRETLTLREDIAKRVAKLAGVTPISQDWWDVTSDQLEAIFQGQENNPAEVMAGLVR